MGSLLHLNSKYHLGDDRNTVTQNKVLHYDYKPIGRRSKTKTFSSIKNSHFEDLNGEMGIRKASADSKMLLKIRILTLHLARDLTEAFFCKAQLNEAAAVLYYQGPDMICPEVLLRVQVIMSCRLL